MSIYMEIKLIKTIRTTESVSIDWLASIRWIYKDYAFEYFSYSYRSRNVSTDTYKQFEKQLQTNGSNKQWQQLVDWQKK